MTAGRRLCWKCQEPIETGQAIERPQLHVASGAGASIEIHRFCPARAPRSQTSPSPRP